MQRILYISDFEISGGAEEVHKNTFLLMNEMYECDSFYGSKKHQSPLHPLAYIFSLYYFFKLFFKLLKFKPQIIHLHTFFHNLTPSILLSIAIYKRLLGNVKVILTAHEYHLVCPCPGYYYLENNTLRNFELGAGVGDMLSKRLDHRGFLYSTIKKMQWIVGYQILRLRSVIDLIVCPSFYLMEVYKSSGLNIPMTVIRNPIASMEKERVTESKIKKQNVLKLLYFGRISFEKGVVELIEQLSKIKDVEIHLAIIGDGPLFDKVKTETHDSLKIEWMGRKTKQEIIDISKEYSTFVLPSLWLENAPLSIIEAYFMGLTILTKDYGGMKEMAELCDNYILFNDENLNDKIHELSNLVVAPLNKMKEVELLFSQNAYREQLTKLYKSIYA